jgi:hypothetical protein
MDSLAETDEDILTFDIPELGGRANGKYRTPKLTWAYCTHP